MGEACIENAKYRYLHDQKWPIEAIDVHHVVVRRSTVKGIIICFTSLLSLASAVYLYPIKDQSITFMCLSFLTGVLLIQLLLLKPIKKGEIVRNRVLVLGIVIIYYFTLRKPTAITASCVASLSKTIFNMFFNYPESVTVMPSFGVQLETHHVSGRIIRRFIPIDKILKPVLVECVTPVTCFWSLSLIVRGEEKLMLVFKELRPPAKMLIPIWKALCAATGNPEIPDTICTKDSS